MKAKGNHDNACEKCFQPKCEITAYKNQVKFNQKCLMENRTNEKTYGYLTPLNYSSTLLTDFLILFYY